MFARASSLVCILTLAAPLVAAVPTFGGNSCNSGNLNCCNSVKSSNDPTIETLAGVLGVALPAVPVDVGVNCTPLNILGVGGNSCSQQTACCTGNQMGGGVITIACSPFNVNA